MHKIVLFGGTTEGRILTEFLSQNKIPAIVCVATEYGEKVLFTVAVKKKDGDVFQAELVDYMQGKVEVMEGTEYYAPFKE